MWEQDDGSEMEVTGEDTSPPPPPPAPATGYIMEETFADPDSGDNQLKADFYAGIGVYDDDSNGTGFSMAAEGKAYLTVALGCTGGRHRSVTLAEGLAAHLKDTGWPVLIRHREIEGRGTRGK